MTDDYVLSYGTHATPEDGRCAMEWVSHLAGEPHSDNPACVSPVLRAMCIALNDGLDHGPRQRLRPYLARTIGTAGDGHDDRRAWLAIDWLIREYTPTWLALAAAPSADGLVGLPAIADPDALKRALEPLSQARRQVRAARRATYGGRSPRGWAAALAAGLTGREAAWSGPGAAAWAAARLIMEDPWGDQVRLAARMTAGDAAAIAVHRHRHRRERREGGATREPAGRALEVTLQALTDSAIDLLERMLPTEHLPLVELAAGTAPRPAGDRRPPSHNL